MTRHITIVSGLLACAVVVAAVAGEEAMDRTFAISSPAFSAGQPIPPRFTADGSDVNPELRIENPPNGVATFALIVDDPDAPVGTWVHWVVWNLPSTTRAIAEDSLPDGAVEGRNSWGRKPYRGPAPPSGTHRYFFKLYALDTALELPAGTDKAGLEHAMQGHVLAEAVLMGTYRR
jgi:Raf kinase inhibitor-like YbhB/YbcL family protein